MSLRSKVLSIAAAGSLILGGSIATAVTWAGAASATTPNCLQTSTSYAVPYGCGGAQLQYMARGLLDMSADGNYWDAAVRVSAESNLNTSEDWIAFPLGGKTAGGEQNFGSYVVMFAPNRVIPGGCGPTGTACTSVNDVVTVSSLDFCLSVEDNYHLVRGQNVQRWDTVLRPCFTQVNGPEGLASIPEFDLGDTPGGVPGVTVNSVFSPDPYQVWSPVLGPPGNELFVNEALKNGFFRHGFGTNARYVLDDRAFGGAGTQLLAYPANGGINQFWKILGCTPPVTLISGLPQICP